MPTKQVEVEPEVALQYKDIIIYHCYGENYADDRLTYWYTTGTDDIYTEDDGQFNIRELKEYNIKLSFVTILKNAIDNKSIPIKQKVKE